MEPEEDESTFELPPLPSLSLEPPDCPLCGEPMDWVDGDWGCQDCNGEAMGPETG